MMKILYVEDNPSDADLTRRWLRRLAPHMTLETVETLSDAIARITKQESPNYDLILTNLRLPDGDGLSLLTYIQERGLPFAVVVITGTGDEKTAITALKAGADDYVSKRDDYLERLPITLENALRYHRAQAARQSRPLKALYAERHDTDIDLTLRHLRRYAPHIQLDVARTGAEVLQGFPQSGEASRYDVILLDYRLPGLNALEVLKELRRDRAMGIPVVLVTGQGDEEVALQALKLGAAGYLVKNPGYLHQLPGELENAFYRAEIIREQAALKQSEERLRLAQRAARVGTWDWNLVTGESNWSEGIYELLGLEQGDGRASVEDFVGFLHPEDREPAMDKAQSVIRNGEEYYDEFRVIRPDGSIAWLASKGRVIRDESGSAERMIGVNIDITERKRGEEALRESEARFRNMADNSPVMVWMADADGAGTYMSQSWYEFTGQAPGTALGSGWVAALHPDDRERSEKTFLAANEKREAFRLEYRLRRNDGEYRWVIDSAKPRFGSQGEFLGYIGSVVDVTGTKRAELNTQFINQLDFELSQITDADEIIRLATGRLGEYLGVASCYVIEVNPAAGLAFIRESWEGWRNAGPSIVGEYRISDFVTPECLDEFVAGRATVVKDVMNDPRIRDFASKYKSIGVGAFISIPALNDRQWEANLTVDHPQARDWRPDETQLMRDITARLWPAYKRARAAEALRDSEERYRSVVESQTELICRYLPDTTLTFVNDAYCRYFDKTQEELIGVKFLELIPQPAREASHKHVESLVENPRLEINEHEVLLPDGGIGWQQWVDHAILDSNGKVMEFQAVGRDITERKQAEEERREGEERLRLALEAGRMGVWEWDMETDALKWSREHYTIMGLEPFSFEPKNYRMWADHVYPDDIPVATGAIRKAIDEKGEYRCEYRIIWPDGSVRWVEGRGKPIYDEGGRCLKVSGLIVDITERKEAEEALRENEEALRKSYARIEDLAGRLIASQEEERRHIARELHDDLNQQVAALAIGISRLKRQIPDAGAAVQEQIFKLLNKTDLLSERIRQVSHELHSSILQHVGLPAALNSYCAEFSDREGIAVALDIGNGIEDVPPEAALCIYRVAQESLRNVARHSGARRAIVTLARANGAVELRVADQGVGFDPGQARECRGLGLVSMEERVKLLHGNFLLTTRPGAGTELRAQIPLRGENGQTTSIVG
jgi:PAS domain S-box-containing protein